MFNLISSLWSDLSTTDFIMVLIPICAGITGVAISILAVISWIRRLVHRVGRSMDIADKARIEQANERKTIADLNQKINFLIEEAKKREKDEKQK